MRTAYAAAALAAALLGLAACETPATVTEVAPATTSHPATTAPPSAAPRSAAPTPAATKTVIRYREVTATPSAAAPAPGPAAPATTRAPAADPNVTDPWAVVSAYYGDIESGDYAGAWALLDSGMTTGQTYQQFVDGFACTGSQALTETGSSGDEVSFDLAATDNCTGAVQNFSGTDTVQGGLIVAADVSQTS